MPNILYFGDNLEVLRRHIASESVDRDSPQKWQEAKMTVVGMNEN